MWVLCCPGLLPIAGMNTMTRSNLVRKSLSDLQAAQSVIKGGQSGQEAATTGEHYLVACSACFLPQSGTTCHGGGGGGTPTSIIKKMHRRHAHTQSGGDNSQLRFRYV